MSLFDDETEECFGTILVVDDEEAIRNLLTSWLEPSGFKVILATNGREGVDKALDLHPDAVILDASMPVMGGFEALAEFKRHSILSDIPIMMLTVHYEVRDIVSALDHGAADYMQKPFNPQVLMARLRAIIRLRNSLKRQTMDAYTAPAMLVVNHNGTVTAANQALCDFLGISRSAVIGATVASLLPWFNALPWLRQAEYSERFSNVPGKDGRSCQVSGMVSGDGYTLNLQFS